MLTDDARPESETEDQNLGNVEPDSTTEPEDSTADTGTGTEGTEVEDLRRQLENERTQRLQGLEREKRERDAREAAERRAMEMERTRAGDAPTNRTGIPRHRVASRVEELRSLSDKNLDAAVVAETHDMAQRALMESQLSGYPEGDRDSMRLVMERYGVDTRAAALMVRGAKAEIAARDKDSTTAAIEAEGARRVAADARSQPKAATTSVRPVGSTEVQKVVRMTFDEFEERMSRLDPMSKEALDLNRRTEVGYDGKDKIELRMK
jgi:hypothetical protein